MSFSFNVRAADKAEAKAKVAEQLDSIVAQQPVHSADRDAIEGGVEAYLGILRDTDDRDVNVTVSGSVGRNYAGGEYTDDIDQANINITVSTVAREPQEEAAADAAE